MSAASASESSTPAASAASSTTGTGAQQRTEKQKMLAGEYYHASDPEIQRDQSSACDWMVRYNATLAMPTEQRFHLLKERLGSVGEGSVIRPPFHCDYGYNLHLGTGVFLNFGCIALDVVSVHIGDGTQVGPGVQFLTADHPRDPKVRATGAEFGRPIRVGKNCWFGGGALVLPGVTIGNDVIVGAGAVVTKDVPDGATVVGNPARIVQPKKQA